MSKKFDEFSETAQDIQQEFEVMLMMVANKHKISLKDPPHDIAKRLLHEIEEFEMVGE